MKHFTALFELKSLRFEDFIHSVRIVWFNPIPNVTRIDISSDPILPSLHNVVRSIRFDRNSIIILQTDASRPNKITRQTQQNISHVIFHQLPVWPNVSVYSFELNLFIYTALRYQSNGTFRPCESCFLVCFMQYDIRCKHHERCVGWGNVLKSIHSDGGRTRYTNGLECEW